MHIVVKQVVKLSSQVSASTQTEDVHMEEEEERGDERREQLQMGYMMGPTHTDCDGGGGCLLPPLPSSSCLDFSTQTEEATSYGAQTLQSTFDLNDLATQTDFSELLGFGTKSASSQTYLVSDMQRRDMDAYLRTPSHQQGMEQHVRPLSAMNMYSRPGPLQSLECVGTQTTVMNSYHFEEGPGMGTQTSPNDFYCPLTDDDSRIDFGTQTSDWLTDVASLLPSSCYEIEPTINQDQSTATSFQADCGDGKEHFSAS